MPDVAWEPAATCPYGQYVLVSYAGGITIAQRVRTGASSVLGPDYDMWPDQGGAYIGRPSHWMPLPPPPGQPVGGGHV